MKRVSSVLISTICAALLIGCSREDVQAPMLMPRPDTDMHYRLEAYIDAGCDVADDQSCLTHPDILVSNPVDVQRYGSYVVQYSAMDEAGNTGYAERIVDVVLPLTDYYSQEYQAYDTCTSGNFFYTGLVQDCDCDAMAVTVGNISNFGLSASFTLPVSGTYNHMMTLDTVKAAVTFFGTGMMSPGADTIFWEYLLIDSVQTDVCRSTWIK